MTITILLWVAGVLLVGIGLAGIILPALPGHVLIFAGLLLAAWAEDFSRVGVPTIVLIGVLAAASYLIDFIAGAMGAGRVGASRRAMVGAALGTLLGLPLGLPGLIFGPLAGALAGELSVHRDWRRAGRVGMAAWIGFLVGAAVKVSVAFMMIAVFLAALWLF